jgi:Glyoxalase-like domain
MTFRTELDHIVVACKTLDEGHAWCRETLGVEASGGGKHSGIGTHNTLLSLGSAHYLEIIAIDPGAPAPPFPRWFGLDTDEVKSLIAHEPRLIAWVARIARTHEGTPAPRDAIERVAAIPTNPANVVRSAERGDFRWRFAFTSDGARPRGGVLPHFIQWDVTMHPCDRLSDVGVSLSSLVLSDPVHEEVTCVLEAMRFADTKVHIGQSSSTQLVATLNTPKGLVVLE